MSRYIDVDALIEKFKAEHDWSSVYIVEDMPTADVVEVVHGKWIPEPNCYYRCSNCKGHLVSIQNKINYSYCPYCGAKMRGETDEHTDSN